MQRLGKQCLYITLLRRGNTSELSLLKLKHVLFLAQRIDTTLGYRLLIQVMCIRLLLEVVEITVSLVVIVEAALRVFHLA